MHAYLVTGNNQELVQERVRELVSKLKVQRLNFSIQKIIDTRELNKFTNLALNEKTAIVIENFDGAGEEAQNAFLKNLEEPQENLIYILTARNEESVLPTIASRCQIVETGNAGLTIGESERKKIEKFLAKSVGEKLKETSGITKREDAILFIKEILVILHERFNNDPNLLHSVELTSQTLRNLELNGNVQIQLTNLVANSN